MPWEWQFSFKEHNFQGVAAEWVVAAYIEEDELSCGRGNSRSCPEYMS